MSQQMPQGPYDSGYMLQMDEELRGWPGGGGGGGGGVGGVS